MAAHNSVNERAFFEAQQYSQFILTNLHDGLLPDGFTRDVSDFGTGSVLDIKTVGSASIQDVAESQALKYNKIDTGTIKMFITDYVGDAWSISDELREDGAQIEQLAAMRAMEATRAMQENFESRFLETAAAGIAPGTAGVVNGFAHRTMATGTGGVVTLQDLVSMKLAFDKANVPAAGRIAIVDPVVEASLNSLVTQTNAINFNPMFEGFVQGGFAQEHKFVINIMGFDIYTSNRLPGQATETIGSTTIANNVQNVFMSVLDDNTKPVMRAWRRMPNAEGWRETELREDRFHVTSRFGFGVQRNDSLGVIVTSAVNY